MQPIAIKNIICNLGVNELVSRFAINKYNKYSVGRQDNDTKLDLLDYFTN